MAVTRKTRRLVQRAALWGATALVVCMSVFLGMSTYKVYTRMVAVEKLRVQAEGERDALRARNEALTASVESLGTQRGVEEEIRTRYPLVRPGEVEFVLVGAPATTTEVSSEVIDTVFGRLRKAIGY
jgi:cell division protein FtsB